jgi:hypothetical protein
MALPPSTGSNLSMSGGSGSNASGGNSAQQAATTQSLLATLQQAGWMAASPDQLDGAMQPGYVYILYGDVVAFVGAGWQVGRRAA